MKPADRDKLIRKYFEQDMNLLSLKGHDYAGDEDCMANFRTFGFTGIVVRMSDKMRRLERFAKTGTVLVSDEGMVDTLRDLSNYAYLARVWLAME
jgi:hypothetical protein